MEMLRRLPGFVLLIALAGVGAALMVVAWMGWADRFGWPVAVGALMLSVVGGFNAFALVGGFFFAYDYLHWEPAQCIALSAVGLLFATKGTMQSIATMLIGENGPPRP